MTDPREHQPAPQNPWPGFASRIDQLAAALAQHIPSPTQPPEQQIENTVGTMFGAGAAPTAMARAAPGVLHTFGGINSKTADRDALAIAQALEQSGTPAKDIWHQTGWMRAPWDQKWRYELDDSLATQGTAPRPRTPGEKLDIKSPSEVWQHPELSAAYPQLDSAVKVTSTGTSPYSAAMIPGPPDNLQLWEGYAQQQLPTNSIMAHELQHALQKLEGFAGGGSMAFADYPMVAGEAEARLTQHRLPLSAAQRRQQFPLDALSDMLREEGLNPGANFENLVVRPR